MADYSVHLSQAKHNEELAKKLVLESPFHDWGITAAFYASIHYIECWLFTRSEKHTETSIPVGSDGRFKYSPHSWREKIAEKNFTEKAWKSFRKLRDASETARYLSLVRIAPQQKPQWLGKPAPEHFSPDSAKRLVETDLSVIRNELKIT